MPPAARKSKRPAGPPAQAAPPADAAPADPPRQWRVAAVAILLVLTASATLTHVWNYDIFWHLAAGEWMFQHKTVLDHDPFSSEARGKWVNVHWGFQLVVAGLHAVGGFALLSVLKCAVSVATLFTLAWALRRRVPPGWLIFSGAVMLVVMAQRVRVRPELFTCLFLMLTVVLLEGVRLGASRRRLWWLVPIMAVWVNMHGLYFLGLGVIWSALLGAWLDRRLGRQTPAGAAAAGDPLLSQRALGPILAATVACLVSPWPVEAAAHPLLLWTRVSGRTIVYTYGVAELQPTWEALGAHWPSVAAAALVALVLLANRRSVPLAHAVWLVAFAFAGLLARRNVGLIAPVCGYLLARHGAAVVRSWTARRPRWRRLDRPLTWAAAVAAVVLAGGYATGLVARLTDSGERFGPGLLRQNYPLRTARFLRDLDAEGEVFCEGFGSAAVFIYHTAPRRKVWMDGRLEVHSVDRFAEQMRITNELRTEPSATWAKLPEAVRFLVVGSQQGEALSAMMESRRFRLIYVEPAAACFARSDFRPQLGRPDRVNVSHVEPNLGDWDRRLTADHRVAGLGVERRRWFRQNPSSRVYRIGAMMLWLGRLDSAEAGSRDPLQHRCTLLAVRYLTAARAEGLVPRPIATGMLAWAHHQRSLQLPLAPDDDLPADMNLARALHLYQQLDLKDLRTQTMRGFADRHVHALVHAGQFDTAERAVRNLLKHLPPAQRVNPPREYLKIRGTIAQKLTLAEVEITSPSFRKAAPLERARAMVAKRVGMIDRAIEQLESLGGRASPAAARMLGDLRLRRGQGDHARKLYQKLLADAPEAPDAWQLRMRLALCDWMAGRLFEAERALADLVKAGRPAVGYYRAVLLEQLGRYDAALVALPPDPGASPKLRAILARIRKRLETR